MNSRNQLGLSPVRSGSDTSHVVERRAFEHLRTRCSEQAKLEYEMAVQRLLRRYNTTIHENRFVVGGVIEVFTYALLRSVGIECDLCGSQSKDGDIMLADGRLLSIKGTFTGVSNVKLLNQLGAGNRSWIASTLFVVSGVGIVFGAPDMVRPDHVKSTGDGVELKRTGLQYLIDSPENVVAMNIARKPPTENAESSEKASTALARQILSDLGSDELARAFRSDV